ASNSKLTLGVTALKLDDHILGYEVTFASVAGYFQSGDSSFRLIKAGSYVVDLTGNLVISLPPGATGGGLRPYAVIGGGMIHARSEDFFEVATVRRTVAALNLGVGATGMFTNNVGVRFDLRYLKSLSTDAPTGGVGHQIA